MTVVPPPVQQPPVSTPQPPGKASGCALGCFVASLLLLLATIGGSLYLLARSGHLG